MSDKVKESQRESKQQVNIEDLPVDESSEEDVKGGYASGSQCQAM